MRTASRPLYKGKGHPWEPEMAAEPLHVVVQHLRRLVGAPAGGEVTDGQLLARFVQDGDQAAFELLVRRHERMVWGVCPASFPRASRCRGCLPGHFPGACAESRDRRE